jgi:hypothetical protein
MKSIKPGRGPSVMAGFGSLVMVIFGILWTILAFGITSGAPMGIGIIFPLFGVCFVLIGIGQMVYNFTNATRDNRFSSMDLVDEEEEPDPLNEMFGREGPSDLDHATPMVAVSKARFVHTAGAGLEPDFEFCPKCGRDI